MDPAYPGKGIRGESGGYKVVSFQPELQSLNQPCLTSRFLPEPVKLGQLLIPIHHCKASKPVLREEIVLIHIFDGRQLLQDSVIKIEQVEHLGDPGPANTKALSYLAL